MAQWAMHCHRLAKSCIERLGACRHARVEAEKMKQPLSSFLADEDGQDLIEYTLLLAFIVFTLAGLFFNISGSTAGIVNLSNSQISYANSMLH